MINPSTNGWIDKYFADQNSFDWQNNSLMEYYKSIRATGFIYGHIVAIQNQPELEIDQWKSDEISKVALLNILYGVYCFTTKNENTNDFIEKAVVFYNEMNPKGFSFLKKMMPSSSSQKLEGLINDRVQTNKDIISKNFSHIVTNALLFVDVLAFYQFLLANQIPEKYLKKTEEIILSIISLALKIKTKKSAHDDLLIKLFEASVRYTKFSTVNIASLDTLPLDSFSSELEYYYLIDLAGMALWNDGIVEIDEIYFLHKLGEELQVSNEYVENSIASTSAFINQYKNEIQYFNYSNPVKHFYEQTTSGVQILIKRNQKRLTKEISESKELMQLLAQSTIRDLDKDEKKKVKKQLLDICKSIPSLTIFLLPGGGLLLPILVKFIPQLLPSAFNENLED